MAVRPRQPHIKWSNETFTIRDVVLNKSLSLPIMVKVEEGIYGSEECESFSQDDLIKIDSVKPIKKVVVCMVDHKGKIQQPANVLNEDEQGYVQCAEDMTIPLRYKGILKLFHPEAEKRIFSSVAELIKVFPRYVKVKDTFTDREGNRLTSGELIELDRILPGKGLMCSTPNRSDTHKKKVVLDVKESHRFLLMPDHNEYTLQQVVDRLPLPQYVTFIKGSGPILATSNLQEIVEHYKLFDGTVKIKSIKDQEMVIGHYKPPESLVHQGIQQQCKRTLLLIPVASKTASSLEVRVPLNDEDDEDYELVMAKNFSKSSPDEDEEADGTVYLEYLKKPKAMFIPVSDVSLPPPPIPPRGYKNLPSKEKLQTEGDEPTPPPRPLRRTAPGGQPISHTGGKYTFPDRKEDEPKPPPRPPKKIESSKKQPAHSTGEILPMLPRKAAEDENLKTGAARVKDAESKRDEGPRNTKEQEEAIYELSSEDSDIDNYEKIDETQLIGWTDDQKANGNVTVQTKEAVLARVPSKVRTSLFKVHEQLLKFARKQRVTEVKAGKGKSPGDLEKKDSKDKHKGLKLPASRENIYRNLPEKRDKIQLPQKPNSPKSPPYSQPSLLQTQPEKFHEINEIQSDAQKWFDSLNSGDLYKLLTKCNMDKLAVTCRDEHLDGTFFRTISDEELKSTFKLSGIQVTKFKQIKNEGWVPKQE